MERFFFAMGSLFAALGVAAGAFGAHGLRSLVDAERMTLWEKAVRYQMYHALALMLVAWAITQWWHRAGTLRLGGWFFILGILLFSGSLYALTLKGNLTIQGVSLGLITPVGGAFFLLGWLALLIASARA
ncbi:MAG: DUF423 domain-containing protein [Anaerolineae bacterium]|nr:MAG: DUF423 domain-containing protein [Anaerolineae bacterium]